MELRLTSHFKDRWGEYFQSGAPSPETVIRIIRQSVVLIKGQLLYEPDGTQYKLLSTYWHPDRKMVIKVDWISSPPEAVTVITGKSKLRNARPRPGVKTNVNY